jgi:ABC-2 type transport system permease protein
MVAHLLRLKLTLLRNSLRRSPWQLVGLVLGGLYGLSLLVLMLIGLVALGAVAEADLIRTVMVLAGSAVVLGWLVIPLVLTGVDMTLDPARFVTFAVPMPQLMSGLALGGLIGVPGAVTLLAALGQIGTWWREPAAAAAAVVCAGLVVLLCIVASRMTAAVATSLFNSRRFKDVSGIVLMVPLVLLGPIIGGATAGIEDSAGFLPGLAAVLAWTPLGSLWSVPSDVAEGLWLTALLRMLIGVASLLVLAWLWKASLGRALVTPPYNAVSKKAAGNLGFFRRFPGTPAGAVAARALTYWIRDPRYGASLIMVPLIPVLLWFIGSRNGDYALLQFTGPITAFLIAWSISADISYDNTAFWLHVSTGVSGLADRCGRALALGVFAVPVTLLFTVVPLWIAGSWELMPAMLGLSLGLLLTGAGLSSVASARYIYNVPLPGESPLKTPPGSSFSMMLVQGLGLLALLVLSAPELVLTVMAVTTQEPVYGWLSLAAGLLLGSVLLAVGLRVGGRWYDSRTPELLESVSRNK